jgi:hypothetical protein
MNNEGSMRSVRTVLKPVLSRGDLFVCVCVCYVCVGCRYYQAQDDSMKTI